jgi:ribose/xylose/arabinose/galactoside ABC-type transport system permease subunit
MAENQETPVRKKEKKFFLSNTITLFIVLIAMLVFFSLTSKSFLSTYNLVSMLSNLSFYGIVAAVLTMVLISGEIDFSIGGNIGLTSIIAAILIESGVNGWLVIILCLLLGAAIGVFNGFLVTIIGVNSIIATVGTMSVWRGLAYTFSDGQSIMAMTPVIDFLGRGRVWNIPFPIILFIIIFAVCYVVMNHSKWGRKIYAIGVNPMASFLSGINVKQVKFLTFLFSGIAAALGGLILASLSGVGMPQHGEGLELTIVSAILLGGTALGGGRGQILGTLVGVLIISVLYNGLTMLNVYYYYVQIAQGAVLVAVVATYEVRQKRLQE